MLFYILISLFLFFQKKNMQQNCNRRWSSISVIARQNHTIHKRSSWRNRQKRKTFPPAIQEDKLFTKSKRKRKSLMDVFQEYYSVRQKKNSRSFFWLEDASDGIFQHPPTISTQSSHGPILFSGPIPQRFSAVYVDLEGQVGKTTFRRQKEHVHLQAGLFLFGFLFFPCWWIGALLYFKQPGLFAYLNLVFSLFSLCLIALIIFLLVWLSKSTL